MAEDGSKAGYIFGNIGGFLNMAVMVLLIIKIILLTLDSLKSTIAPNYLSYSLFIFAILYIAVLGVWMFSSAFKMRFSYSLHKGAKICLILGILSLNPFAIIAGVFGLIDGKVKSTSEATDEPSVHVNSSFRYG
ncbi:MAG: hypothetical protein AABX07_02200 [Nanoarchaeota archaeon]